MMSLKRPRPRVLIVDDDQENVDFVRRTLESEFEVVGETSPRAALQLLETSTFHLVLADQRMPEMLGTEFLERALLVQPAARRVILSAFTETDELLTAINRCRIHRFLSKPVARDELLACARVLIADVATHPDRCLVLDEDLERGGRVAEALRRLESESIRVDLATDPEAFRGHAFVLLCEPSSIDRVQSVVKAVGGAERQTVVLALMPEGAIHDAGYYLRAGVEDVVWPPFRADEVLIRYRTWRARRNAEAEADRLRGELLSRRGFLEIVGQSESIKEVFRAIDRVAKTDTNVLLYGETGTGKELVAHALHAASQRCGGPFVAVNLSAVPETLVEAELFGHEAGAFTGARRARPGRMELVEGGTLFLDEIGDLSLPVQTKLLRVVEERRFERVGSNVSRAANFRLVCATHRDLEQDVHDKRFREDLFYRINVVRVDLPPLRERSGDVPLLALHFLQRFCKVVGKKDVVFGEAAMAELMAHDWPGNVRELEHAVERAVALATSGDVLQPGLLMDRRNRKSFRGLTDAFLKGGRNLDELLLDVERTVLTETMQRYNGNQSAVARKLGIARTTLRSRLAKHGM